MKSNSAKFPHSFRKPLNSTTGMTRIALGISTAMLMPMPSFAADDAAQKKEAEMQAVQVVDTAIDPNPNAEPDVPY